MDRALKVDLKKKVRGIKAIERKAEFENDKKSKVVLQYCQAIRYALLDEGKYPLEPGGLKLYRMLRQIKQSLERNNHLQSEKCLEKLLKVLSIVDELKPKYRRVKRLYKLIFKANAILKQKVPAAKVQADMRMYVDGLRNLNYWRLDDRGAVLNILEFTVRYWDGLFHHYDHKAIPRTNNDLETYIGSLKVAHRKTTGRASCQAYIIRYGAYVALLDPLVSQVDMLVRVRFVGYGAFRQCFREIRSFRGRLSFKRVLKEDLKGFLCSLELDWAKTIS
jgi:hypothetical protein